MSLWKNKAGIYEATVRRKDMKALHLSMRTKKAATAKDRYAALRHAARAGSPEFIEQVRRGVIPIERLSEMVSRNEPLVPVAADASAPVGSSAVTAEASAWGTVDETVNDYLDWMRSHPNKRDGTRALAGYQIKRFQDALYEGQRIGDLPLDRVPSAAIQAYQTGMLEAKVPVNTITTYMARVGALWRWAAREEERQGREQGRALRPLYSPVDVDRIVRETHRRDRVLTQAEAEALLASTPDPLRFPIACGLLAGLRVGEMLHLRPGLDVDVVLGTISIRDQPNWKPKTKRARRLVPMADALRDMAVRHIERYASDLWMVPSPAVPGEPLTDLAIRLHLIKIVERAGMIYGREHPQGVTFHTLRHSFASHAVMRGVDLYTVAKLLGDSLKMVEDVYADLSPDFKRAAVRKLASAFSFSRPAEDRTGSDTEADTNEETKGNEVL